MHPLVWRLGWRIEAISLSLRACTKACGGKKRRRRRKGQIGRDRAKERGGSQSGGWREREREENCVPTCSVIKRNIDSTPVYRVIHIHGGWRLCLFASVVPSAFSPYCCRLIHTIYVPLLPYQLRSSLSSLSFSLLLLPLLDLYRGFSLSLRPSPLRFPLLLRFNPTRRISRNAPPSPCFPSFLRTYQHAPNVCFERGVHAHV